MSTFFLFIFGQFACSLGIDRAELQWLDIWRNYLLVNAI